MGYKIKIKNKMGTMLSREFKTKQRALSVMNANKKSDIKINQGGFRKLSTGRLIKITNRYSLVKTKR